MEKDDAQERREAAVEEIPVLMEAAMDSVVSKSQLGGWHIVLSLFLAAETLKRAMLELRFPHPADFDEKTGAVAKHLIEDAEAAKYGLGLALRAIDRRTLTALVDKGSQQVMLDAATACLERAGAGRQGPAVVLAVLHMAQQTMESMLKEQNSAAEFEEILTQARSIQNAMRGRVGYVVVPPATAMSKGGDA